jgi:NADH:ubiquinone oxidoreductase subunit F (NADH-binding)/NADH:ubiquinone oxidoreductase subunit E
MTTQTPSASSHNSDERFAAVERTMQRFNYQKDGLIETLITAQEVFGGLSKDVLTFVSDRLHVPMNKVYGVATFYDSFTLEPVAETHTEVCTGPMCTVAGAREVLGAACKHSGIRQAGQISADGSKSVREVSCLGLCDQAPAAMVNHQAQVNLTPYDIPALMRGEAQPPRLHVSGNPRELTGPIGRLAPTDLDAHRAEGAFEALEKALRKMTPEQVIAEVKESRLTGRGGAGFPTGVKWEMARQAPSHPKYTVCNFDESEPGTFKDRALMEGNPFRVLEGLVVSAYAVGAHQGYVFVRGEYPTATDIVEEALDEMYTANLLGEDILDTGFDFRVEVRHNAGAYVCGEETAQFEAIEGARGQPRIKPPYPTVSGLFGKPTAINNVETLAVVPSLVLHGGEWFHQWGTAHSVGLKLFCLSGHVKQPGVVEAPLGLTVRELIEEYGGGFEGEPQAILLGGAAGGFLHPSEFDTPLTHEDLRPLDVPIGSGAVMVFNQTVDLWEVLESLAHFFVHETCGQCAPCRLGTQQIHHLIQKINSGIDTPSDRQKLERLGQTIRKTCKCGLGLTAANPSLTYLHHFEGTH